MKDNERGKKSDCIYLFNTVNGNADTRPQFIVHNMTQSHPLQTTLLHSIYQEYQELHVNILTAQSH